ncbi:MAG TPA: ATP-dependent zinc metalloprotease FtsH [Chloroflexi bacterium]|nr:ATP-dependent zinc metalloprotease FtsH [Chloroflexota bacterium]
MKWSRVIYLALVIGIGAFFFSQFFASNDKIDVKTLTEIATLAKENKISKIEVQEDELEITLKGGATVAARKETGVGIGETLGNLGVSNDQIAQIDVTVLAPSRWGSWVNILATLLPLLLIGAFFFFIFRQAQGAGNQAMSFGKSKAKMFTGDKPTVTFEDVAGAEEAKEELNEVVEFLREPEKFISLGARIPKGVLMVGPPGCGKTLMAKAVSGEAGVPFFSISGSEFVEMFVGVGASRVRDLFEQAKRNSPCIIFIDEIDAVGRHRGAGLGGSHDEREQTLNQILVEMDGFDTDTNVIIVAATNRPDILDPALLRPGRFDRRVVIDRPDWAGREKILGVHVRGKPLAADVDLSALSKMTVGFVGADLENLVNEAAILAARYNRKKIQMDDFQEAMEKIQMGPERKNKVMSQHDREVVAYHEAGHAIVAKLTKDADPVHKVSIVARGRTPGATLFIPEDDRTLITRKRFQALIAVALGGRAAEDIIFPAVTTGAGDDLARATKLARAMVTQYGMSDKMGPVTYGKKEELVFLGKEIGEHKNYSESSARTIDLEVRNIVGEAYALVKKMLANNRDKLAEVANLLLSEETIDKATFNALFT